MRYTVQWRRTAEAALADIWLCATDRQAVTRATHEVDRELAMSPETKGLDFYGDRLLLIAPLHVVFRVEPDDRRVTVLNVWSV